MRVGLAFAFGLLLLVRRDYASVGRAAGAFLACAAIGYALDPAVLYGRSVRDVAAWA